MAAATPRPPATLAELEAGYGALDPAAVGALDAAAEAVGVDVLQLMEVAGLQVARLGWRLLRGRPGGVLVVAGRGNNGGDGLVAARHLRAWGCSVTCVVVAEAGELRATLTAQVRAARGAGVEVEVGRAAAATLAGRPAALVVDALLGTGLRSAPRGDDAVAIAALAGRRVLAVDLPSGLDAGSGTARVPCVQAVATCTLTAVKTGLWTGPGRARAGILWVADIGMPATAWAAVGVAAPSLVRGGALRRVPHPPPPDGDPAGSH